MMQDLRENTKIIMLVVALAFVGLMVFEWGMDISGQSSAAQTGELGRVNGEPIDYALYSAAYQQLYDRARQQTDGELSPEQIRQLEQAAFDQVVADILLRQELERRGITVTDEEVRQAAFYSPHPELMQNELFLTDGRFDITKWQQFLSSPAANEQLLFQLEQYYRGEIPRMKLMQQVAAGTWMSDAELWRLWQDRNETATVDYVPLELSRLAPGDVEVSDKEIEQYYRAHRDELTRPATARFTVAILSKATSRADTVATLERAQQIRQEIVDGADFAAVAQRESADPGSREQGGDLGTFGRGQMVPGFEEVAFSLPVGTVSEPVLTPFGYHLIQVQERTGDQVRARHILIPIGASDAAQDALYARADSLEDLASRVGIQRAARAVNAGVRSGVVVTAEQAVVPGIGSLAAAVDWAQEESRLEDGERVSPVFETPDAFYVVEREAFTPAGRLSQEEATPQIRRDLILEKKRAQARKIGQEMVAQARAGQTLEQVAQARGLTVQSYGPFTRLSPNPVFGQATAAVGAAFGTPVGTVSDVVETPAGLFIVKPTARTDADRQAFEAQKEQIRTMATFQAQQEMVGRFLESLRKSANIVDRRDQVLQRS